MSDEIVERAAEVIFRHYDYKEAANELRALGLLTDPARMLPDPKGGCICNEFSQDAGGGYVEHLLEYEPACPEHSTHLYDPRTGVWINRAEATEVSTPLNP